MLKLSSFTPSFSAQQLVLTTLCALLFTGAAASWADEYSDVATLLRDSQYSAAGNRTDELLRLKPNDPQLRFFKGVILNEQRKTDEAIEVFVKLTQDYPELPEPYNNLAVLYAGQSQYDKARAALQMAIRTNPSYSTAHENLGDVYARLASQAYSKALQLDQGNNTLEPKLRLIRELFAPNSKAVQTAKAASSSKVAAATPVVSAVVASIVKPALTAVPTAAPVAPPVIAAATPKIPPMVNANGATIIAAPPIDSKTAATSAKANNTAQANNTTAQTGDAAGVEEAVRSWARAWASKNMEAYYASYAPEFRPTGGQSRSAWEADRKNRIMNKRSISVQVSDIQVSFNGDQATARFRQDYRGDALQVSSQKTLKLRKNGNRWGISSEGSSS